MFRYLDDLLLLPLGITLAQCLLPAEVLADRRAHARRRKPGPGDRRLARLGATLVLFTWTTLLVGLLAPRPAPPR